MRVKVRTILDLVEVLGGREVDLEVPAGSTVADLLATLAERSASAADAGRLFASPEGRVQPHVRVLVNGRQIAFLRGPETELLEGDEVLLLPAAAGG